MNWFYASRGQRAGPVDEHEFTRLVADGAIDDATLVWRTGMPGWLPYAQARASGQPALPADPAGHPAPTAVAADLDPNRAQCSQCAGFFPAGETVRVEGYGVCAGCKPFLLQKIDQGLAPAAGAYGVAPVRYAGFWIRFAAVILDVLILSPLTLGLWLVTFVQYSAAVVYDPSVGFWPMLVFQAVLYLIVGGYDTFFVGRYGASPGKMVCGLRVERPDETPLSYGRALGRFFARLLSYLAVYLGCVMAAFDHEKRSLHDYVADTRVVYK